MPSDNLDLGPEAQDPTAGTAPATASTAAQPDLDLEPSRENQGDLHATLVASDGRVAQIFIRPDGLSINMVTKRGQPVIYRLDRFQAQAFRAAAQALPGGDQ